MERASLLTRTIWCCPRYLERLFDILSIMLILSNDFLWDLCVSSESAWADERA